MSDYRINGYDLTLEKVAEILADPSPKIFIAPEAEERCRRSRRQIDRWMEKGAPAIYGVNTGLGALKDVAVPAEKHEEWNRTLSYPHSAGFGDWLPPQITRLALLLRCLRLLRLIFGSRRRRLLRLVVVLLLCFAHYFPWYTSGFRMPI